MSTFKMLALGTGLLLTTCIGYDFYKDSQDEDARLAVEQKYRDTIVELVAARDSSGTDSTSIPSENAVHYHGRLVHFDIPVNYSELIDEEEKAQKETSDQYFDKMGEFRMDGLLCGALVGLGGVLIAVGLRKKREPIV